MGLRVCVSLLSFCLFHTPPPFKHSIFVSFQVWLMLRHFSPPPALPEVSLLNILEAFRGLTSHPAWPHFPCSACCALLTLASSARRTGDALLSPLPSHPSHCPSTVSKCKNNYIREEQLIRHKSLLSTRWQEARLVEWHAVFSSKGSPAVQYMSISMRSAHLLTWKINQSIVCVRHMLSWMYVSIEKQLFLPYVVH